MLTIKHYPNKHTVYIRSVGTVTFCKNSTVELGTSGHYSSFYRVKDRKKKKSPNAINVKAKKFV